MIPIPYGMGYQTTLQGQVPKLVQCESCSLEYVYLLERKGIGDALSLFFLDSQGAQNRAEEEARARLHANLMKACEPVPCPECGHVQKHMVPRARQLRYRWVGKVSLYLFPISVLLCVVALANTLGPQRPKSTVESVGAVLLWLPGVLTGLGAIGLPLWRFLSNRLYDPNATDVEARKLLGRSQAVPRTEFEKRQAELAAAQERASNRTKRWRTARKRPEPGAGADGPSDVDP